MTLKPGKQFDRIVAQARAYGMAQRIATADDVPRKLVADAIEPLLRDPDGIERLGAIARATVRGAFDVEVNFERLWALRNVVTEVDLYGDSTISIES